MLCFIQPMNGFRICVKKCRLTVTYYSIRIIKRHGECKCGKYFLLSLNKFWIYNQGGDVENSSGVCKILLVTRSNTILVQMNFVLKSSQILNFFKIFVWSNFQKDKADFLLLFFKQGLCSVWKIFNLTNIGISWEL
jgi:hypothetical protein